MARGMNWGRVQRENLIQARGGTDRMERIPRESKPGKAKGITNPQAKYLASLQKELGEPYSGAGMSRADASVLIDACLERLGRPSKALKRTAGQRSRA
jgi:hypothetical protein